MHSELNIKTLHFGGSIGRRHQSFNGRKSHTGLPASHCQNGTFKLQSAKKEVGKDLHRIILDKLYWLKGGTNSSNSSSGCLASILTLLSIAASGYDCSPTVGPHTSGLHPSIQNFVHLFVLRMSIHSAWRFFTLSQFFKERTSLEARVNSSHVPVDVSQNVFLLMI